jgi:hypothetical protein
VSKKICLLIVATNVYFILGVRFINKWNKLYKGNNNIHFHFVSDQNPFEYLPNDINNVTYENVESVEDWTYNSMLRLYKTLELKDKDYDQIYWFDADTNIDYVFEDNWVGDLVSYIHGYKMMVWMTTNARSSSFIPFEKNLDYYQACFWGGNKDIVIDACEKSLLLYEYDKAIDYVPSWADEKYLNKYFYFKRPSKSFKQGQLPFRVADKGRQGVISGIDHKPFYDIETSQYQLILENVKQNKELFWDIEDSSFIVKDLNSVRTFSNE